MDHKFAALRNWEVAYQKQMSDCYCTVGEQSGLQVEVPAWGNLVQIAWGFLVYEENCLASLAFAFLDPSFSDAVVFEDLDQGKQEF